MRLLLLLCLLPLNLIGQDTIPHSLIADLPSQLNETSGLQLIEGQLWAFEDGGGAPELYQIDTITGGIVRTVAVVNASNVDWEDIAVDNDYVYIGDFGNNNGSRTDLSVYRVSRDSLTASNALSVTADTISFMYADQTSFTPMPQATNFDCEAMVVLGDSLHVFTKRWLDERTTEYVFPKIPGAYLAQPLDSLDVGGLVAAADLNAANELVLGMYRITFSLDAFVTHIQSPAYPNLLSGQETKYAFGEPFAQLEGLTLSTMRQGFISTEALFTNPPRIWDFGIPLVDQVLELDHVPLQFISLDQAFELRSSEGFDFDFTVYNILGGMILSGQGKSNTRINILAQGNQFVIVNIMLKNKNIRFVKSF